MNLELPDEQYEYNDALGKLLADRAGPSYLRRFFESEPEDDGGLWSQLGAIGLLSLTVPEQYGGEGLSPSMTVLTLETLGRFAVPVPAGTTVAVATPTLATYGSPHDQETYLPAIARGELMTSVQDGWSGTAVWGARAGLVLVLDGESVHLCDPRAGATEQFRGVDRARCPARLTPSCVVSTITDPQAARDLRLRATAAAAAHAFGVAHGLLGRTIDYTMTRRQFGRTIASFQAVQHELADAYLEVETGRRTAWVAMLEIDSGQYTGTSAAVAKSLASDAVRRASDVALQFHGGIGYTWEYDLHMWLKRALAIAAEFGSASAHLPAIAEQVMAPGAG